MQSKQDAIYNWLSIQLVAVERPDDRSAVETASFFRELLKEDHQIEKLNVEKKEDMYLVTFQTPDEERQFRFPLELVESIVDQMKREPHKFHNYE